MIGQSSRSSECKQPRFSSILRESLHSARFNQQLVFYSILRSENYKMSHYQSNNINSFNVSNNFHLGGAEDVATILSWLSPLKPQVRHQDIRTQRVEDVGSWLLQTEKFGSWHNGSENQESDHAALFCQGNPGVGKSFITSLVVDSLCDRAMGENIAVVCFYFDFASRKEQTPVNMLGSLLKQLVSGLEEIPEVVMKEYREQQKVIGGRGLKVSGIVRMFQAVSSTKPTFICIDALDECAPEYRVEVLSSLCQILRRSPDTRLFMTGRPHICDEVERQLGGRATSLSIIPTENDIIAYIMERLQKDATPEVMTGKLKEDMMRSIPEKISESFLLVSLNIESILRETTIARRKGRLQATTDGVGLGLENAYGATLERIRALSGAKSELAMATLMWICHSDRPLKVDELCHALAVVIGSRDFDIENVPLIGTLLNYCQGLITVDKEASTVRLVHHTLQEYLSSNPDLFPRAHSTIAETCLTYLNSQSVKSLPPYPLPDLGDVPFLRYASLHWGTHAKREFSNHARSLAFEVMDHYEDHISAILLLQEMAGPNFSYDNYNSSQCTGLHCTSFFGIVELAIALMEMEGSDINKPDCSGLPPISWAVLKGHEALVKLLLKRKDVNPNAQDHKGLTPLWCAAALGHDGVVKLLLERKDVNPDRPDYQDRTPLRVAARAGHDSVVKLLLGREDVNPDRPDNMGTTPLLWAANNGHDGVVKLLLERGEVNPDRPDNGGRTPLWCAANNGHDQVVKLLLESEDLNPDAPNGNGRTPLWTAAAGGHDSVVKLLLERTDVNPNMPDNDGWTPLSCAASNGHDVVFQLLKGRVTTNPDTPEMESRALLCQAAVQVPLVAVKTQQTPEVVNLEEPKDEDQKPPASAFRRRYRRVVEFLRPQKPNPPTPVQFKPRE